MTIHMVRFTVFLLYLVCHAAWAGRPFLTDDAALTAPQTCQVETWMQLNAHHHQDFWVLPACNPTGNLEFTAGFNQLQTQNGHVGNYVLQGKTLFREMQTNSWGMGVAFGTTRPRHGAASANFIYLPYSLSFADDALIVHANLGWVENRAPKNNHISSFNRTTGGLGAEYRLASRVTVFSEVFGDDVVRPIVHTGLNIQLISNKLNLNMTGGRDLAMDAKHNFYSVGLNFYGLP